MLGLTPAHLLIILVIALVVIGPGKLPEVGSAIGKSLREFQKASSGILDSQPQATQQAPMMQAPMAQPMMQAPMAPPQAGYYAAPQQPQQYAPQQYAPQAGYAPEQYLPQAGYAPQQYAPQQYAPQQYAPQAGYVPQPDGQFAAPAADGAQPAGPVQAGPTGQQGA
jgi:TatA/E family protein of Tat protein translocase